MNIKAFNSLLRCKLVHFKYKKVNGDIREAHGTLAASLIPPMASKSKYKCTDIEWDADGEKKLPKKMNVELGTSLVESLSEDAIEEELADELSNKSGFCVKSFKYEKLEPKKLPEGSVFYYDTDSNGYRSFKAENLLEVLKD